MKRTIFMIMVLVFLSATPTVCATDIAHNFNNAYPEVNIASGNKSCTITQASGIYTYTCGGSAEFALVNSQKRLKMTEKDDYVTLSPAIENLSELTINYTPIYHIAIYISTNNGATWEGPLQDSRLSYSASAVKAIIPKNTCSVKIVHTDGTDISISMITYTQSDCNCFKYIPE